MKKLSPALSDAIRDQDLTAIREELCNLLPSEIAGLIADSKESEEEAMLFFSLPRNLATKVFEYLPHSEQTDLIKTLANDEVGEILNHMADDDRTKLFDELPGAVTKQLLTLLSDEERKEALALLGYPKRSVGRLMTPHYVSVHPSWTVKEVLDYVREHGQDSETLTMVYVVDNDGILIDDIRMRLFLLVSVDRYRFGLDGQ